MSLLLDGKENQKAVIYDLRLKLVCLEQRFKQRNFYQNTLRILDELEQEWDNIPLWLRQRWVGFVEGVILCKGLYKSDDQMPSVSLTVFENL